MENPNPLIVYRRSWKRTFVWQGITVLVALLLAVWLWPLAVGSVIMSVAMGLVLGVNIILAIRIAWRVSSLKRDVVVTLDEHSLTCTVPGDISLRSFSVSLDEITAINKIDFGSQTFTIRVKSGSQYDLNDNYGIPSQRIVDAIVKVRPSIRLEIS